MAVERHKQDEIWHKDWFRIATNGCLLKGEQIVQLLSVKIAVVCWLVEKGIISHMSRLEIDKFNAISRIQEIIWIFPQFFLVLEKFNFKMTVAYDEY